MEGKIEREKCKDEEHLLTAPLLCRSSAKVCLTWLQRPSPLLPFPSPLPRPPLLLPSSAVLFDRVVSSSSLSSSSPPPPPPSPPPYLLLLLVSSCLFGVYWSRHDVSEQLLLPLLHRPALPAGGVGCKHVCVCVIEREREREKEWLLVYLYV